MNSLGRWTHYIFDRVRDGLLRVQVPLVLISIYFGLGTACSTETKSNNTYRPTSEDRPLVDEKYSISADRKAMEDFRKDIPPEKKRENDEMALILGLMSEVKKEPQNIRASFDRILRNRRELFDKDMKKERETFTQKERKDRDSFLAEQAKQKKKFQDEKHTREERTEFFKEIDGKRTEFFSNERDRRNDFESDVRERRKSFEDYTREKTNEFNQEHRAYVKKYEQMKKEKREQEQEKERLLKEQELQRSGSGLGNGNFSAAGLSQVPKKTNNSVQGGVDRSAEARQLEEELERIRNQKGTSLESGE